MENLKIKKNKIGRPKYKADEKLLKDLYIQIANNEISNEERLENSTVVGKTKWYELKKKLGGKNE